MVASGLLDGPDPEHDSPSLCPSNGWNHGSYQGGLGLRLEIPWRVLEWVVADHPDFTPLPCFQLPDRSGRCSCQTIPTPSPPLCGHALR